MSRPLLALLAAAPLVAGCPPGGDPPPDDTGDTGDSADSGGDSTETADTAPLTDTGMAELFFVGGLTPSGPTDFGLSFYRSGLLPERASVCDVVAEVSGGDPSPPCVDCELAFTISVSAAVASGTNCAELPFTDGALVGYEGAWGFADRFVYTYGDYALPMDDTVWYFLPEFGDWYLMSFRLYGADYYGYAEGDATGATFAVGTGDLYAFSL